MDKSRRADLDLWAITAEGFLSRLGFGLVTFGLPLYAYHLGLSLTDIGLLTSINLVASVAVKPLMGWFADRFGLKLSFVGSIGLRSIVAGLLVFATLPWQLYVIRSLYGVAQGMRDPALNALLAERGGEKTVATGFAWYATAKNTADSIGGAIAGFLLALTASNYQALFFLAFLMSLLPLFVVAAFVHEKGERSGAKTKLKPEAAPAPQESLPIKHLSALTIILYIGLGILISGTAQMLRGLLPLLAKEYAGLNSAQTGAIYLVSTVCYLVSGPLFGWLSDNVSRKLVLMTRGVANTVSSALFMLFPNFWGLAVGSAVDNVGKSAFKPAWGALMAHVAGSDRKRQARTMGYLSLAEDIGEAGGPVVATLVWSAWGVPFALGGRILLAVVTEIYAAIVTHPLEKQAHVEQSANKVSKKRRLEDVGTLKRRLEVGTVYRILAAVGILLTMAAVAAPLVFPGPVQSMLDGSTTAVSWYVSNVLPGHWILFWVVVIGVVTPIDVALLYLLVSGLRQARVKTIRATSITGSDVRVTIDSLANLLCCYIKALPDIVAVEAQISPKQGGVGLQLNVEACAGVNLALKADEMVLVARHVVEEKMSLKLSDKLQIQITVVPPPGCESNVASMTQLGPQEAEQPIPSR